jgi:class 3 adenylate cyclase
MNHPAHAVPAAVESAIQALGSAGVAARPRLDRRLAAVLIADVAGYSRLMEQDETGTHVRLQTLREDVIEPALVRHGGRITRSTGDGLLVTFASATHGLRCAVEIQREVELRNTHVAPAEQIRYRMGLNIGDILFDEHDIAGICVNLAARLEALAKPGEICISQALKEQLQEHLDVTVVDAGSRRVKNITRPVHVYRVLAVPPAPRAAVRLGLAMSVAAVARWRLAATGIAALAALAAALPDWTARQSDWLATAARAAPHGAVQRLTEAPRPLGARAKNERPVM